MRIITWNVNGLRAAYKKGFLEWIRKSGADIVCLQEIKAKTEQLPLEIMEINGYYSFFNSAERPGYSGTVIYSKEEPIKIKTVLGMKKFDEEGRGIYAEYGNFSLLNLYIPHGGRHKENLDYKLEVYNFLLKLLEKKKNDNLILVGDFNIAHQEIDLARPKDNQNNIMFTPKERQQIDKLLALGLADSFRELNKEGENYTWWPYFRNARERNLGWRIDYLFTGHNITSKLKDAFILKEVIGSDHCPAGIVF